MRAIILAGGKGTRLRPYTVTIPKPLVPVGDMGIMEVLLRQLRHAGCERVTVAVGHQAHLIEAYFGNGERWGIDVDYAREHEPLGTIGPLKRIPDLPEHFLVMNGDVLTDLNFRAFFQSHVARDGLATVAVHHREVLVDFGVLEYDVETLGLTSFSEKPLQHFAVSMGVYAFSKRILDVVPDKGPFGFDELMLTALNKELDVCVHAHSGYWLDIGRPEDYDRAGREFSSMVATLIPDGMESSPAQDDQ
jgi:NDP-mannose synthase